MMAGLLVLTIGRNLRNIKWPSTGGDFAHLSEPHGRGIKPLMEFPLYDGVPISTHYWTGFAKYAKIGLVQAGILPISRR